MKFEIIDLSTVGEVSPYLNAVCIKEPIFNEEGECEDRGEWYLEVEDLEELLYVINSFGRGAEVIPGISGHTLPAILIPDYD